MGWVRKVHNNDDRQTQKMIIISVFSHQFFCCSFHPENDEESGLPESWWLHHNLHPPFIPWFGMVIMIISYTIIAVIIINIDTTFFDDSSLRVLLTMIMQIMMMTMRLFLSSGPSVSPSLDSWTCLSDHHLLYLIIRFALEFWFSFSSAFNHGSSFLPLSPFGGSSSPVCPCLSLFPSSSSWWLIITLRVCKLCVHSVIWGTPLMIFCVAPDDDLRWWFFFLSFFVIRVSHHSFLQSDSLLALEPPPFILPILPAILSLDIFQSEEVLRKRGEKKWEKKEMLLFHLESIFFLWVSSSFRSSSDSSSSLLIPQH